MKRFKLLALVLGLIMILAGCGALTGGLKDGEYTASVSMNGGTGKAYIENTCHVVIKEGKAMATIVWSSKNYDYMVVDGQKLLNEANAGEPSQFTIPVKDFDKEFKVIADTVAMSTPHEIEYTIKISLKDSVSWQDLNFEKSEETKTQYATLFKIEKSGPEFTLITIADGGRFLLVDESIKVPKDLPEDVTLIRTPLKNVYCAASSSFDPIVKVGAIDSVRFSGIKAEDLYIEEAKEKLNSNYITYAGKYSAPDYELLVSKKCDLAIENTMIYHDPMTKEKLESMKIPVFVERSSYEEHPMGRVEWVKVYGALFGKENEAKTFFEEQSRVFDSVESQAKDSSGKKKIAFFHVNSNGVITVRKNGDYVVKLIELAGADYALKGTHKDEENALSTMNLQMEDFYLAAKDADILIYNSTIVGELKDVDELIKKNAVFKEFKAVKEGNIYCTEKNFYQETTGMANLLKDLNNLVCGEEDSLSYLKKL